MATAPVASTTQFNPFAEIAPAAIASKGEKGVYLDKRNVHDITATIVATKFFPTDKPGRSIKVGGVTYPGMNFIIEFAVEGGESTQADIAPGTNASIFLPLDPGMSESERDYSAKEIAEYLVAVVPGISKLDALDLLRTEGPSYFEDETRFAGKKVRIYSKEARKNKAGEISVFRNFGYDLVAEEGSETGEESAPVNKRVARRGTTASPSAD